MGNFLLNLIKPMLNNKQRSLLDNGLAQINNYRRTHQIRTKQDVLNALQHFGVPRDFLSNTGGLANNPVVQKIANVCNIDIDKVKQDISGLLGTDIPQSDKNAVVSKSDPLKEYRDSLSKLK